MDKSSDSQNGLVEKYVTGLMSIDEAFEFEAFILDKPDWQQKVNRARDLYEEVYDQEWENELNFTLAKLQGVKDDQLKEHNQPRSWLHSVLTPMVSMAFGALLVFIFMPQSSEQPLGKIYSVSMDVERSFDLASNPMELFIEPDVDHIALKIPVGNDLSKEFSVRVKTESSDFVRKGFLPDEHGMISFSLARDFRHDELITVSLESKDSGTVFKEFHFIIKEN